MLRGSENDGTELYYYRARYYSPEMGRFTSEDPIGFAWGVTSSLTRIVSEKLMHFLKEPIDSIVVPTNYSSAYESLHAKLIEMHCDIEMQDKDRGEIVIKGVWKIFNMFVWHCWADKLIFEINPVEDNKTNIDIFGLPNLFKIKVKKKDKLIDISKILTQIKQLN